MSLRISGRSRCYHLSAKREAAFRREKPNPLRLLRRINWKWVPDFQVRYFRSGEGARRHVLRAL